MSASQLCGAERVSRLVNAWRLAQRPHNFLTFASLQGAQELH